MKIAGRRNAVLLVCAVSLGLATLAARTTSLLSIAQNFVEAPVSVIQQKFVPAAPDVFGKSNVRVLVVGLDYDYDKLDQETSKSARSDIIMALNLDLLHHKINELSVPRDMIATLPNGQVAKINQAQSDGGIQESQRVIAGWLNIPSFDRYVVMRIDTSKDLINAIGGIEVNVQNSDALKHTGPNGPLNYDDDWGHLHIHFQPGRQHLDGEHAVAYARFRHDWCSDPCRILRQQQVIRAIIDKIEHDKFNTVAHTTQLLSVLHKDLDTNFTFQEEIALMMSLANVTPQDIRTAQVPYSESTMLPDYGDSLVPDETAKKQLVASLFSPPGDIPQSEITPPNNMRLHIENGTMIQGLAARVASRLRRQGFTISEIGDAPDHDRSRTEIRSGPRLPSAMDRLRTALGHGAKNAIIATDPETTTPNSDDITIILGRDVVTPEPSSQH